MLMTSSEQENYLLIQIQHFQSKAVFALQSCFRLVIVYASCHIYQKGIAFYQRHQENF